KCAHHLEVAAGVPRSSLTRDRSPLTCVIPWPPGRHSHARYSGQEDIARRRRHRSVIPLRMVMHTRRVTLQEMPGSADPMDPRGLRSDAPLLDAWLRVTERAAAGQLTPISVPGHKQPQALGAPRYGGLDTIKHADVLRAEGEARAARLWGADWCRFSVAGSTHGNQALALTVGSPGQEIIVTRILHRSLLLGLVLAGLRPVWVRPAMDLASGLPRAGGAGTLKA